MDKAAKKQDSPYGEIETLVRARYPLLYIHSWEEQRVLGELAEIAGRLNKQLYVWTVNEGLRHAGAGQIELQEPRKGTRDPLLMLREIAANPDPAIYALLDFHAFLREAAIARALRDLANRLRSTLVSVALLAPRIEIPPELEKDITLLDYPLPDRQTLGALLDGIANEVAAKPDLHVELNPDSHAALVDAAVGLTLNEAENVFARTLVTRGRLSGDEVPLVFSEKEQIVRKTGLLEYVRVQEDFRAIGGLSRLKEWLRKRRLAFSEDARRFGLDPPKGVLILGIQGCGKSLCAKAVPGIWQLPLLRMDMGRLFDSLVGSSEHNVRQALRLAESVQPAVLWIDEIEKGFSGLESSSMTDSGTAARVLGTILTWLQEKQSSVFVIATANHVELLPPELLRKGRFDEIFFVDLPDPAERLSIFKIHLAKRRRDPAAYKLDRLVEKSKGFSGAEIEQAVVSALFDAYADKCELSDIHLMQALTETVPLSTLMADRIDERRRWAQGRTRPAR